MSKASPLFTFFQYIAYLNRAMDAHQIHSPFVYQLYTYVIQQLDQFRSNEIEQWRKQLYRSKEPIETVDFKNNIRKQISVGQLAKSSASSNQFSYFLRGLVDLMEIETALECGTSFGINTRYLSSGKHIKKIASIEGNPNILNHASIGLSSDKVNLIRGDIYEKFSAINNDLKPELIYLDADHRSSAIEFYLDHIKSSIHTKVIIVHDIYWSRDMHQAWKAIIEDPEFALTVDIFEAGLIFPNINTRKQHFTLKF